MRDIDRPKHPVRSVSVVTTRLKWSWLFSNFTYAPWLSLSRIVLFVVHLARFALWLFCDDWNIWYSTCFSFDMPCNVHQMSCCSKQAFASLKSTFIVFLEKWGYGCEMWTLDNDGVVKFVLSSLCMNCMTYCLVSGNCLFVSFLCSYMSSLTLICCHSIIDTSLPYQFYDRLISLLFTFTVPSRAFFFFFFLKRKKTFLNGFLAILSTLLMYLLPYKTTVDEVQ